MASSLFDVCFQFASALPPSVSFQPVMVASVTPALTGSSRLPVSFIGSVWSLNLASIEVTSLSIRFVSPLVKRMDTVSARL